jgi:hypothetical protein
MFRIFVLLIDFGILGFLIFMTIKEPPKGGEGILMVTLLYLFVIINLIYVQFSKTEKESWIHLYFQRKRLEEKKKIENLKSK